MNIYCANCEHACSEAAPTCPRCGHPLTAPGRRRPLLGRKSRKLIAVCNLAAIVLMLVIYLVWYTPRVSSPAPVPIVVQHVSAPAAAPQLATLAPEVIVEPPRLGGPLAPFLALFNESAGWELIANRYQEGGRNDFQVSNGEGLYVEFTAQLGVVTVLCTTAHVSLSDESFRNHHRLRRASLLQQAISGLDQELILGWFRDLMPRYVDSASEVTDTKILPDLLVTCSLATSGRDCAVTVCTTPRWD